MKRFFALTSMLILTAGLSFGAEWTGYVTDAKCASAGKYGADHANCAQACIKGGSPAVLVSEDGDVHEVANPDKLAEHAGAKVKVTGSEADGKITVESVEEAS